MLRARCQRRSTGGFAGQDRPGSGDKKERFRIALPNSEFVARHNLVPGIALDRRVWRPRPGASPPPAKYHRLGIATCFLDQHSEIVLAARLPCAGEIFACLCRRDGKTSGQQQSNMSRGEPKMHRVPKMHCHRPNRRRIPATGYGPTPAWSKRDKWHLKLMCQLTMLKRCSICRVFLNSRKDSAGWTGHR